jgi:hypothetical protein
MAPISFLTATITHTATTRRTASTSASRSAAPCLLVIRTCSSCVVVSRMTSISRYSAGIALVTRPAFWASLISATFWQSRRTLLGASLGYRMRNPPHAESKTGCTQNHLSQPCIRERAEASVRIAYHVLGLRRARDDARNRLVRQYIFRRQLGPGFAA